MCLYHRDINIVSTILVNLPYDWPFRKTFANFFYKCNHSIDGMALNKSINEGLNFFTVNYCFPKTITVFYYYSKNSPETMWFLKIKHSIFYCKHTVENKIQLQLN